MFKRGAQVRIRVDGADENNGRVATVDSCHGAGVIVYFGAQDEELWVYGDDEMELV